MRGSFPDRGKKMNLPFFRTHATVRKRWQRRARAVSKRTERRERREHEERRERFLVCHAHGFAWA